MEVIKGDKQMENKVDLISPGLAPEFIKKALKKRRLLDDEFVYLKLNITTDIMIEKINAILNYINKKKDK